MFRNFEDCLLNNKNVYTEEVNKIALSSNDDKRLQTHDKITTYPYGANAFKECESKVLVVKITIKYSITTINIKRSTLITILMKIKLSIIKIGHIFQIIHIEY